MAYNNAIPAASDRLKDSQPQILDNFASIQAFLGVNHDITTFANPAAGNEGKHKYVTLVQQGSNPGATGSDAQLFTKDDGSGVPSLFFQNASRVTDMMTGTAGSAGNVSTVTFNLWVQFNAATPWVAKLGVTTNNKVAANAATTITYPAAFSSQTGYVIAMPFTGTNMSNPLVVQSVAAANFVIYNNSATAMNIFFLAVGR